MKYKNKKLVSKNNLKILVDGMESWWIDVGQTDVYGQTEVCDATSEATTLQNARELCSNGQRQRDVKSHGVATHDDAT